MIAGSDIHTSGHLAEAIACGADAAMLGAPLAAAAQAPGQEQVLDAAAAHPSLPRGALLQVALGDDRRASMWCCTAVVGPFGQLNVVGGLRRSITSGTPISRSSRRSGSPRTPDRCPRGHRGNVDSSSNLTMGVVR